MVGWLLLLRGAHLPLLGLPGKLGERHNLRASLTHLQWGSAHMKVQWHSVCVCVCVWSGAQVIGVEGRELFD